jgi:hypothetical protein
MCTPSAWQNNVLKTQFHKAPQHSIASAHTLSNGRGLAQQHNTAAGKGILSALCCTAAGCLINGLPALPKSMRWSPPGSFGCQPNTDNTVNVSNLCFAECLPGYVSNWGGQFTVRCNPPGSWVLLANDLVCTGGLKSSYGVALSVIHSTRPPLHLTAVQPSHRNCYSSASYLLC